MSCFFCHNSQITWKDPQVWIYRQQLELCQSCTNFYLNGIQRTPDKYFKCSDCDKEILKDYAKPWAKTCYPCWKKRKDLGNVPFIVTKESAEKIRKAKEDKAKILSTYRAMRNNPPELIQKKANFIFSLAKKETNPLDIITFEMYPLEIKGETIKSKKIECAQYPSECKWHNTRVRIKSETRAEVDNLPYDQTMDVICEICLALINKGYSFSVWYAEGQRSPHIVIYDFDEMREFDGFMREQLQKNFWREVTPLWKHLDKAVWEDEHFVPLEYAPHWKYGTPFNLIFEYNAEETQCNQ